MLIDKALEYIGLDKGTSFVLYLIQYSNPETKIFSRTYKQIQEDLKISPATIARYFKTLEQNSLIFRAGEGKWFIPAVIGRSYTCEGPECYVVGKLNKK